MWGGIFLKKSLLKDMFLLIFVLFCLREREGRERNFDVRVGCLPHTPLGIKPATYLCAVTRNKTTTFWCTGRYSKQLNHWPGLCGGTFIIWPLLPLSWICLPFPKGSHFHDIALLSYLYQKQVLNLWKCLPLFYIN